MKKILLFLFLISTTFVGRGQNLVPNGDFEQYSGCPSGPEQLDSALFWINPSNSVNGGTPDYFNQCVTTGGVDVPKNVFGFQYAHSGIGYCGIVTGRVLFNAYNWREYAEIQLTSPLVANTCYYFEMYISLANRSMYTSEEMGVYFSDSLITGNFGWLPLPYTPQLNLNLGFLTDTLNWVKVYGNYTPVTAINYLIIGNFYDSSQTTMPLINPNGWLDYSYFYIDDVLLAPCTGIEEQNQNDVIKIYPNPAKDFINISFTLKEEKNVSVEVYDLMGRPLTSRYIRTSSKGKPGKWQSGKQEMEIDMRGFSNGIYVVEINTGEGIYRKKVLKE